MIGLEYLLIYTAIYVVIGVTNTLGMMWCKVNG